MGKKNARKEKITTESLLRKMNFEFSRDAEWFKRTNGKIEEIKEELGKNFYTDEKKKEKIDFLHKLKAKIKDYKDAIKFAERYKKVRFVERRKLERKLNHINKAIEGEKDKNKKEKLEDEKNKIIDDLNYVKFYPKTFKYYSLFPSNDKDNKEMIEKREKMRKKIQFYLNKKNKKGNSKNKDNEEEREDEGSEVNANHNYENEAHIKKKKFKDDFFELDE